MATAKRIGEAVATARERQDITAAKLSERTKQLGFPIHRTAITKIENGSRSGKMDVSELIVLAAALGVPPVQLLYPQMPDGPTEALPGVESLSSDAMLWFSGERATLRGRRSEDIAPVHLCRTDPRLTQATRSYVNAKDGLDAAVSRRDHPEMHPYEEVPPDELQQEISRKGGNVTDARGRALAAGGVVDDA
ncbi:helix-turn-helix transcriptional regulator [Nocardia sp. AG03]|uniref:helix-turn-helix domain-containing protein n=1 Tax=Nocardia sp. AG03 TaxID=3025312 RepID=UPI002418A4D5|nr:helix-turn-helix transcriptional regulator [Nocardia sp. AG03]